MRVIGGPEYSGLERGLTRLGQGLGAGLQSRIRREQFLQDEDRRREWEEQTLARQQQFQRIMQASRQQHQLDVLGGRTAVGAMQAGHTPPAEPLERAGLGFLTEERMTPAQPVQAPLPAPGAPPLMTIPRPMPSLADEIAQGAREDQERNRFIAAAGQARQMEPIPISNAPLPGQQGPAPADRQDIMRSMAATGLGQAMDVPGAGLEPFIRMQQPTPAFDPEMERLRQGNERLAQGWKRLKQQEGERADARWLAELNRAKDDYQRLLSERTTSTEKHVKRLTAVINDPATLPEAKAKAEQELQMRQHNGAGPMSVNLPGGGEVQLSRSNLEEISQLTASLRVASDRKLEEVRKSRGIPRYPRRGSSPAALRKAERDWMEFFKREGVPPEDAAELYLSMTEGA